MPRPPRLAALPAVALATALLGGAAACRGGTDDAGPKRPEVIEIRGTAPSTTALRTGTSTTASTAPAEGTDQLPGLSGTGAGPSTPTSTPGGAPVTPNVSTKPSPPFRVETGQVTLTDTSRPTEKRGDTPASTSRTLVTTMYVPVGYSKAPLLVFAIGYNNSAQGYDTFLRELASAGFMIAVPEFPLATKTLPGPPSEKDLPNQPGDVSFVISQLLVANKRSGPFLNAIDPNRIGVVGQSDGGNTVSALGLNACCLDNRIKGVVSLAGEKNFLPNTWISTGTLPYLEIHGTADTITPFAHGEDLFKTAGTPKFLVPIAGADHLGPVTDKALRPKVVNLIVQFLDFYVNGNPGAMEKFTAAANEPPMSLRQG